MMVDDMLFDPILAAEVILNVKLPPHEELRLMWAWTTYYTNDDSGFSTGKSWTFALMAALRSILIPDRVSGILSKTFAQGKLIFDNFDRWYDTAPIFRGCVKHSGGKKRLVHGNDVWIAEFRSGSQIRVLPPNFLGDAERIRSERWNDAYLDEWTTYGNFKALNTTIMGRVSRTNRYKRCPVRQNHVHLASTPAFEHHPSFKMVKVVQKHIENGNKDYGRFTVNYRHVPDTAEWDWMVDRKIIYHMQTNNAPGAVKSEIDGLWSKDSESYYNSAAIDRVRLKGIPLLTRRVSSGKSDGDIYIGAFDTARGGADDNSAGQGDDFSFTILRMLVGHWKPYHVLTVRKNKITDVSMAGIIHKYHRLFGLSLIIYDPSGGGLFVRDKLRMPMQIIDNEPVMCDPIITVNDTSGMIGSSILVSFSRGDHYIKQMWGKMQSDSVLVNRMHKEMRAAVENKNIVLAGEWNGWQGSASTWDAGAKRDFLNKNPSMDNEARIKAEMDLAVSQLIMVDVLRGPDGAPLMDKYNMYKFKSKEKKDSAYSLIYANTGCVIYRWLNEAGMADDLEDDNGGIAFNAQDLHG
jgi:hypothetical protein